MERESIKSPINGPNRDGNVGSDRAKVPSRSPAEFTSARDERGLN